MTQYLVDIHLPGSITDEIASLIPFQRTRVNALMSEGTISDYSLSMDRSKLWVVVNAATEDDVRSVIASFPIFPFIQFTVHELMFHNSVRLLHPQFSLN